MFKKIASNTVAQLVAKFFGAGLTLLTTYFLIRQAGIELYGDLTKVLVLVAVGFTTIDFGLNAEAIRSSSSSTAMQANLRHVIAARLIISAVIVIFLNLLVLFLPGGYSLSVKSVFWVGSLAVFFQGIYTSCNAWFQYKLGYWKSTISVVLGSLFGAGMTLYALSYCPSLLNFVLANTLGYFVMAISSIFLLPTPLTIFRSPRGFAPVISLLKRSLTLGLILIASVLASKIDTILLGIFRTSSEVGEYGFAYRIFDVILVLPVFIMNIVYPLSLQNQPPRGHQNLIRTTIKTLGWTGILIGLCLWFLSPGISYVRPGLTLSIQTLKLLSFSLPLFYLTAPLMWNLIAHKQDRLVLTIYVLAALLNAALNLVFIPLFGTTAAAINTGLTELFICLALLYFSRGF